MKRVLFISLLFAFANQFLLNGQTWQWAREETAGPEGFGVCNDNLGNVYTAGYFSGTATVGSYTFPSSGTSALIVKYDPDGNVLWANICGTPNGVGYGVACDPSGDVFFA